MCNKFESIVNKQKNFYKTRICIVRNVQYRKKNIFTDVRCAEMKKITYISGVYLVE